MTQRPHFLLRSGAFEFGAHAMKLNLGMLAALALIVWRTLKSEDWKRHK